MRCLLVAFVVACKSGSVEPIEPIDLSHSLEPLEREFSSHAGEARFIAILSPT